MYELSPIYQFTSSTGTSTSSNLVHEMIDHPAS